MTIYATTSLTSCDVCRSPIHSRAFNEAYLCGSPCAPTVRAQLCHRLASCPARCCSREDALYLRLAVLVNGEASVRLDPQ